MGMENKFEWIKKFMSVYIYTHTSIHARLLSPGHLFCGLFFSKPKAFTLYHVHNNNDDGQSNNYACKGC